MIGIWIDYLDKKTGEDMILEIMDEIEDAYICRIVDYNKPTYKLKYGGFKLIKKEVVNV